MANQHRCTDGGLVRAASTISCLQSLLGTSSLGISFYLVGISQYLSWSPTAPLAPSREFVVQWVIYIYIYIHFRSFQGGDRTVLSLGKWMQKSLAKTSYLDDAASIFFVAAHWLTPRSVLHVGLISRFVLVIPISRCQTWPCSTSFRWANVGTRASACGRTGPPGDCSWSWRKG